MTKQEEALAAISAWRASGKSKAAFARSAGISVNTLHYWCKRHLERERSREAPMFIEVPDVATSRASEHARIELALPDGLVITVY